MKLNMPPIAPLHIAQKACRHRKKELLGVYTDLERGVSVREYRCRLCSKTATSELPIGATGYGPMRWA